MTIDVVILDCVYIEDDMVIVIDDDEDCNQECQDHNYAGGKCSKGKCKCESFGKFLISFKNPHYLSNLFASISVSFKTAKIFFVLTLLSIQLWLS